MVRESNQNVFLIQIDSSSFAKFELFEFELSRFDCMYLMEFGKSATIRKKNIGTSSTELYKEIDWITDF